MAGTAKLLLELCRHYRRLLALSNKVIEIAGDEKEVLTAGTIIINTGAVPTILPIPD